MRLPSIIAAAVIVGACAAPGRPAEPSEELRLAPDVTVRRIAPGLWIHTTVGESGGVLYPANGMLMETDTGSLLIDTGWSDRQAEVLAGWARTSLGRPVRRAIVTHSHGDRTGGIAYLRGAGVEVLGNRLTADLAAAAGEPAPTPLWGLERGAVDLGGAQVMFPGPGHTDDNIVVYFPSSGVLFGGCLVKADTATTIGNVADADVPRWPETVDRVRRRFMETKWVVPGHGGLSTPAALEVTQAIVREKGPAAVRALNDRRAPR